MNELNTPESLQHHTIPGHTTVVAGNGGLPKVVLTTPGSAAEIYLHGAQVTGFQKPGGPPLLFMSAASHFSADQAIRGGVPICFPWFGPREGLPAHGFARLVDWTLTGTALLADGGVSARFRLPQNAGGANAFLGIVELVVTVGDCLTMELIVTNMSRAAVNFESCLHTYFAIGNIQDVSISGLEGAAYVDKVGGATPQPGSPEAIRIGAEVDRVYPDAAGPVEIHDAQLRRVIRIEKSGSATTVVWNPWIAKARAMADFGDEEFQQMVCVESGNIAGNQITLAPGKAASLKVVVSSRAA